MNKTVRLVLAVQLFAGLAMLLCGLIFVPMMPYVLLDVVLTPAELADTEKHDATLEMLKVALRHETVLWSIGGVIVSSLSAIGLIASKINRADRGRP